MGRVCVCVGWGGWGRVGGGHLLATDAGSREAKTDRGEIKQREMLLLVVVEV